MFKYAVLALLFAFSHGNPILDAAKSTKGVVSFTNCGGDGVPEELRVEGCEGSQCNFYGGQDYPFDIDFTPHASGTQVSLKVIVTITGIDVPILDIAVPNSPVESGGFYTLSYLIRPDGLLAGQTVQLKLEIYHTESKLLETCVTAPAIMHA